MQMDVHQTTECVFEVPAGWIDRTRHFYKRGDLIANAMELGPVGPARERMERGLQGLRVSMPGYKLLERVALDRPVKGSELIAQRFGAPEAFEVSVFWTIAGVLWMFRVQGPPGSEEMCREAMESFLNTYEPLGEP